MSREYGCSTSIQGDTRVYRGIQGYSRVYSHIFRTLCTVLHEVHTMGGFMGGIVSLANDPDMHGHGFKSIDIGNSGLFLICARVQHA